MKPAILWGGRLCDNAKTLRASAVVPPPLKLITAFKKKKSVSGASGRRGGVQSSRCEEMRRMYAVLSEEGKTFRIEILSYYQVGFSHTEYFDL